MKTISEKEIEFLLFVNASEESYLTEVPLEIESWDCDKSVVVEMLRSLIEQELVGLGKINLKDFVDLQKKEALESITSWECMQTSMLTIFLTEKGWERWHSDTYDWVISLEREEHLVFSNKNRFKSRGVKLK